MADILESFREANWFKRDPTPVIDSWTFKVYYQLTTSYFVLSSVLVCARQLFGEPVACDAGAVRTKEFIGRVWFGLCFTWWWVSTCFILSWGAGNIEAE